MEDTVQMTETGMNNIELLIICLFTYSFLSIELRRNQQPPTWLAQLLSTAESLLKRRALSNLTKLTYQPQPVPIVYKIGIPGKN